jgi:hypothetical protein
MSTRDEKIALAQRAQAHLEGKHDPGIAGAEPIARRIVENADRTRQTLEEGARLGLLVERLRHESELLIALLAEHVETQAKTRAKPSPTKRPVRVTRKG